MFEPNRAAASFLTTTVCELLALMKRFVLPGRDLPSDEMSTSLDQLDHLLSRQETSTFTAIWADRRKRIQSYADRQRAYLLDRDHEIRDVLELLTRTMAENQDFNTQIYRQSENVGQLSRIDDIRGIKDALKSEVDRIQNTVNAKKARDEQQIELLARQIRALKVELQQARQGASRDDLTGLYTRESFDRYLWQVMKYKSGREGMLALVLIDIDNFDKVCEAYGRPLGERVILAIAQQCSQHVREQDFLARYEDARVAMILPQTTLKEALKGARALCRYIAVTRYSPDDAHNGHKLGFTVSIGVSVRCKGDNHTSVVERALGALAAAQRAGRNRVAVQKSGVLLRIRNKINPPPQV